MNYINNRKEVNVFDSLNMVFFAEGLFGFFTLGFGGGIKVPLGGSLRYYSAHTGGRISLSFYFNYDFPKIKVKGVEPYIQRLCSIDLGIQIGFHFGSYEYID